MTWRGEQWDRARRPLAPDLPGAPDVWASGILPPPALTGTSSAVVVVTGTATGTVAVVASSSSAVVVVAAAGASVAVVGSSAAVVVVTGSATATLTALLSGSSVAVVAIVGTATGSIRFGERADVYVLPVGVLLAPVSPALATRATTPLLAAPVATLTTLPARLLLAPKRKK